MHKKKLLFIIPGHSLGGTTSSLASLLNSEFTSYYDVDVFAINRRNYAHPTIAKFDIGLNGLTTAYNADFLAFSKIDRLKFCPIKILKQVGPLTNNLKRWVVKRTINKIENRKHYDYVISFQEENTTKFTSHFANPNKIAWIHCDYAKSFGEDVDELEMYKHYKRIVCVSDFTRKGFVGRYPSLDGKTIAIHNLFDAEKVLERSTDAIDDTRFDNSHFTILSMGRISEVKRFYLIPEIAARLKKAGLDFRWYILGGGNNEQDQKQLDDAIVGNKVEKQVLCLGGKSNPYPYLKAADLLVSTSKSEACPMVFNEAKLLHVPILSADYGSAFEFVEQGKDGYITSIEEMPLKLIELIQCPQRLELIKSAGFFVNKNKDILKQLHSLFNE